MEVTQAGRWLFADEQDDQNVSRDRSTNRAVPALADLRLRPHMTTRNQLNPSAARQSTAEPPCRLCGGAVSCQFSMKVLDKYVVRYSRCTQCDSLQTEFPFWIDEAYTSHLTLIDTGAGQRSLANLAATYCVSRLLRLNNVLDFGGGDGLLCRLLRDYGINCYVQDKYATATYAKGFDTPNFSKPQILLAFEVLEHLAEPHGDVARLFAFDPDAILASTALYANQGPDWWYLAPESGQHLFFYSEKALRLIAEVHNYALVVCRGYSLFVRPELATSARIALIRALLRPYSLRLVSAAMRLLPTRGVWTDFDALRTRRK